MDRSVRSGEREKKGKWETERNSGRNGKRDSMRVNGMRTDPCRGGGKLFEAGLYSVLEDVMLQNSPVTLSFGW